MEQISKQTDRPDREKIARIICCFAKDNNSCAECEENTDPDYKFPDCFSGIREETDQIIALLEEAKREERERIYDWGNEDCPHNKTIKLKVRRGCIACWQALKGGK